MSIIPYQTTGALSNPEKQDVIIRYAQAVTATVFLGLSILKFLLVALLFAVAFVLWLWGISFQTGRLFGHWLITEKPDAFQTAYRLGEILLFPFVFLAHWSRQKVDELWHIKLPSLPESELPKKCSDLLTSPEK